MPKWVTLVGNTLIVVTGNDFYFSDGADTIIERIKALIQFTLVSAIPNFVNSNLENLRKPESTVLVMPRTTSSTGMAERVGWLVKGNDTLNGYGMGEGLIYGGDGFDYLSGAGCHFLLRSNLSGWSVFRWGSGQWHLNGWYGNDTLSVVQVMTVCLIAVTVVDVLIGGDGNDTLSQRCDSGYSVIPLWAALEMMSFIPIPTTMG